MNIAQRVALGLGASAILVMAIFPPWRYILDHPDKDLGRTERDAGYHCVFNDNMPTDLTAVNGVFGIQPTSYQIGNQTFSHLVPLRFFSIRMDTSRLLVQLAVVAVLCLMLCLMFSRR